MSEAVEVIIKENGGQAARDELAARVNRAIDSGSNVAYCRPQVAADVIEQRDLLATAVENALDRMARMSGFTLKAAPAWFLQAHKDLFAAILTAKGP